jgi:hypothetical protein
MATTVVLRAFTKLANGTVSATFGDGSVMIFESLQQLLDGCRDVDLDQDLVKRLCLAYAAARSADLSNVASVLNKNYTFDLSAAQPIRVQ